LLDIRQLDLPMYNPDNDQPTQSARLLIESCYAADGLLWSSPIYQGTISGALKNSLDWLQLLGDREPPFLHDKVIGLISAAGGTQGLLAINTMEFAVRASRLGRAVRGSGGVGRARRRSCGPSSGSSARAAAQDSRRGGRARRRTVRGRRFASPPS
jgi:FMN reductase